MDKELAQWEFCDRALAQTSPLPFALGHPLEILELPPAPTPPAER